MASYRGGQATSPFLHFRKVGISPLLKTQKLLLLACCLVAGFQPKTGDLLKNHQPTNKQRNKQPPTMQNEMK